MKKGELLVRNKYGIKFYYPIEIVKKKDLPEELIYMIHRDDILEFTGNIRLQVDGSDYYVGRVDKTLSSYYRVGLIMV